MRKKISNSLSTKVFLWVFTALTLCNILIYGIVLVFVPQSYQLTGSKQFETNTGALFSALKNKNYEDGTTLITNFCIGKQTIQSAAPIYPFGINGHFIALCSKCFYLQSSNCCTDCKNQSDFQANDRA